MVKKKLEAYQEGISKISENVEEENFAPSKKEFSDSFVELTETMLGILTIYLIFFRKWGSFERLEHQLSFSS